MMLVELADVCRGAGLTVVEEPGWRTRGHGPMVAVDGAVVHHTAGPAAGTFPSRDVLVDGRPDLDGPLCHLGIDRAGAVHVIASGLAWHAGQVRAVTYANPRRIGIECEATGRDGVPTDWPAVQLEALEVLCAALAIEWHFGAGDVLGHKEVCYPVGRKIDPHPLLMASLRTAVDRRIAILGAPSGPPSPVPPATSRPVLSYGNRGSAVSALQVRLRALSWDVDVTGRFDDATRRAVLGLQVAAGLVTDRIVGPRTWAALDRGQRPRFTVTAPVRYGAHGADVVDVQRALVRVGIDVDVDGRFGPQTRNGVRRREAALDLDVDGVVDRATAAALGGRAA